MTKTRKKSLTDRSAVCKVLQLFPLTADIFVSFLIIRHRVISKQLKTMSCISCSESSIKCLGTSSLWEDISGNRALLTGINALCLSASQYLPMSQNRCASKGRFPISDHQNEHCSNDSLLRKSDGWRWIHSTEANQHSRYRTDIFVRSFKRNRVCLTAHCKETGDLSATVDRPARAPSHAT